MTKRVLGLALLCAWLMTGAEVSYRLSVQPRVAAAGTDIRAALECVAGNQSVAQAVTFDDASLTLVVQKRGAPEPTYAFPNRRTLVDGKQTIHEAGAGGREKLGAGEHRSRSFELTSLFPGLREPGSYDVFYTVYDGKHLTKSPVVRLEIRAAK